MLLVPVIFIDEIYRSIGQDPEVAALASKYVWIMAASNFCMSQAMTAVTCASSMKYMASVLFSSAISSICHITMVYAFVEVFDWGFEGMAIATVIYMFIRMLLSIVYLRIAVKPLQEVTDVYFFSRETFENLGYQFNLGMMQLLMGVW